MIYLQLFISFLQIGMFSFGGGYAAMPLIQGQVVTLHQWLSMEEFTDLITISQMTPGPIAVNSATFVGIKIAGIPGAVVATFGCILPSCVIVTLLAKLYLKYRNMGMLQGILGSLRPAVVAMIASAGISILITAFWGSRSAISLPDTNWSLVVIFVISMILLRKCRKNPILVMVLAGCGPFGRAWRNICKRKVGSNRRKSGGSGFFTSKADIRNPLCDLIMSAVATLICVQTTYTPSS